MMFFADIPEPPLELVHFNWLLAIWVGFLGACIGSFMNVVIYRMPRGKSIVHPGSSCPKCEHTIRGYDNIPIFSWLILRARCRDCGEPISSRYPSVEALIATFFVALAYAGVFSQGANLPLLTDVELSTRTLWSVFALHAFLLCTLTCIALIEFDELSAPPLVFLPMLVAAIVAPAALPTLRPDPNPIGDLPVGSLAAAIAAGSIGLIAGCLGGWFARSAAGLGPAGDAGRHHALVALTLCGGTLGWQPAAVLGAVTALGYLLVRLVSLGFAPAKKVPWTGVLLASTFVWLLGWKSFVGLLDQKPQYTLIIAAVAISAASLATFAVCPRKLENE